MEMKTQGRLSRKSISVAVILVSALSMASVAAYYRAPHPHGETMKISCSDCHSSDGWTVDRAGIRFNHDTLYALEGAHQTLDCRSCHTSLVFNEVKNQCSQCHQDVHQQTLSATCDQCHTTTTWLVSSISEIHQLSRFPLMGQHQFAACEACHTHENPLVFGPLSVECLSCHQSDYLQAANPNHVLSGFSQNCSDCHSITATSWGGGFTHDFFPLMKGHALADCASCHHSGDFLGLSTTCVSCHQNDYQATLNPRHLSAEFSQECQECHDLTVGWKPTTYSHDYYPLVESHALPSCTDCHQADLYQGTSTACFTCHESDYKQAENPNHVLSQFDVDCSICHTLVPDWKPANFDHALFSLTQGHAITDCAKCHLNGIYNGLDPTCLSCHQTDYQTTTNPNHVQAGFSTNCLECHSTAPGWPSTFDHDNLFFPIYSGKHQGEWNSCTDCHTTGSYAVFSCIDCHEHNQADMAEEHDDVGGYLYNSARCFDCHPQGEADDKQLYRSRRF